MEKLLPIGIDDFKEIVNTCYYVDKTMLVDEIIQAPNNSVFLFTRPQRFGKSLSLSMLRYYFSMQEDSAALFKDLLIGKVERAKSCLNSVPVVRFNFKGTVEETFEGVMNRFRSCIADGFRQVSGLIELTKLNEYDADYYRLASKGDASIDYADAIKNLSRMLFLSTEKKTIFLIDEYDAPVESARLKGFYDPLLAFLRNFYSEGLKSNEYLGKAVLTGVTRIAKESLFSGLNNLTSSSLLSAYYGEYFGFSEKEVKDLLSYYHKENEFAFIQEWYGGYSIAGKEYFNPWSVLSYLRYPNEPDHLYWTNTTSFSSLGELLFSASSESIGKISQLFGEESVTCFLDDGISYATIGDNSALFSYLFNLGYLTIKGKVSPRAYEVRFPNREIRDVFILEIYERFVVPLENSLGESLFDTLKNWSHTQEGDNFEKELNNKVFSAFSPLDYSDPRAMQVAVLVLTSIAFGSRRVRSEVNSGQGRCDIMVYPQKSGSLGILIEVKCTEKRLSEKQLKARAKTALSQIRSMEYKEELERAGASPIIAYGFAFSGKRVSLAKERLS